MKKTWLLALLLAGNLAVAAPPAIDDVNAAQRLTELSAHQDVPANDARVVRTQGLLDQAVKVTGEAPQAIAAACRRYAGHLFDAAHVRAEPVELLEALAQFSAPGVAMNDTLGRYARLRKSRTHDEALAAMRQK